jgi:hypothetical protein
MRFSGDESDHQAAGRQGASANFGFIVYLLLQTFGRSDPNALQG